MAAKLAWDGDDLMMGTALLAYVVPVTRSHKSRIVLVAFRGEQDCESPAYECAADARLDCESEVRRLLKDAGVDVEP